MKIYIETNMTEMPKGCGVCPKVGMCYKFDFIGNPAMFGLSTTKRNADCPLRTSTEIAEKAKEKEDER